MLRICTLVALLTTAAAAQSHEEINSLVGKANAAIKSGQHEKAYDILKRLHAMGANVPQLERHLCNVACALAAKLVELERYDQALPRVLDAVRWQSDHPLAHYYLGVVQFKLDNLERSRTALEKAVELDPKLFHAHSLLGVVLFDLEEMDGALEHLQIARRMKPEDKTVLAYLARLAKDHHIRGFKKLTSPRFTIRFDDKNEELSEQVPEVVEYLEKIHQEFTYTFRHSPKERVTVVIYSKTLFAKIRRTHWAGGFFDGKVRVPLDGWRQHPQRAREVLRHELAHAFVHSLTPDASAWVQEGVAQWLEGVEPHTARKTLQGRKLVGLEVIRKPFADEKDESRAHLLYAQAMGMVSHLYESRGKTKVAHFLSCFAKAEGTVAEREDAAMKRVYGKPVGGLLDDFIARYHLTPPR